MEASTHSRLGVQSNQLVSQFRCAPLLHRLTRGLNGRAKRLGPEATRHRDSVMPYRFARFWGGIIGLALSACTMTSVPPATLGAALVGTPVPNSTQSIYYFLRDENKRDIQIQRISPDGPSMSVLLDLPIDYPVSALPSQEQATIYEQLCGGTKTGCSQNPTMTYDIDSLALSPDKHWLAWPSGASWCMACSALNC